MARVAVVGATGYAGAELVRLLAGHPVFQLSVMTSRQHAGKAFSAVYPGLSGHVAGRIEEYDPERITQNADFVFTALPHKRPLEIVPELVSRGLRVVDLSADFRFKNPDRYESVYQTHTAKDLLAKSVYGLCEIYPQEIRRAQVVGNPGCYPTSVLLPLIPLIRAGALNTDLLIADAKSGVSGAGRSPSQTVHFCEVTESFKAYKAADHRHNPEMDEVLTDEAGYAVHITFVPHLVPMSRGMLTTIYAQSTEPVDVIRKILESFYANAPFVQVLPEGQFPETRHVRGTNTCRIGVTADAGSGRVIIVSAIDNLGKGAAGQALQCMNHMAGCEETAGLTAIPLSV